MALINGDEVAKHHTAESCWVVIHGKVWDVTNFLAKHPGGAGIIIKCAGGDATESYDTIHNPELIDEMLPVVNCLGILKPNSLPQAQSPQTQPESKKSEDTSYPPLESIIKVSDFEKVAERHLSAAGWAYYSSGAEDEMSLSDTRRLFSRIVLRPRILRNVNTINTATDILAIPSSLPIYISPTGMGRYAHRDAEKILSSVAGIERIIYCPPTKPSNTHEAIFGARSRPGQRLFAQLYADRDRAKTQAFVQKVEALGAAAIFLTVDSPVLGRRERDDRVKFAEGVVASGGGGGGVAQASAKSLLNAALVWDDLEWMKKITKLPIVLKGIQSVEDAVLAYQKGARGIVLSNHGGRSLDTAQAPVLTLLEINRHAPRLLEADIRDKFQVLIDGGVRRGTDVLKCLALGATAVGVGRPFLYSMTAGYGAEGVTRLVQMFKTELETSMAMLGAASISSIVPEMVNSERAEREVSRRVKL